MKNNIRLFLLLACAVSNTASYSLKNCIINGSKLSLCTGPTWLEAYYYFSLLCQKSPPTSPNKQHAGYVKEILKKHDLLQHQSFYIDTIKPDMQEFTHSALSCTADTILINTPLFNKLTDNEKEAIIVHAALRIEKKHIRTHALVLASIPICTELILKLCRYGTSCIKNTQVCETLVTAGSYFPASYLTKLILNTIFTHYYFKYQAKQYDLAVVKKLKSSEALASFYTKMHTLIKQKSLLLSLRQPSYEARLGYLVS